jgi:outer membrane lipase/esterase
MKGPFFGWLFALVAIFSSSSVNAYSNIFIFGDSFSDSGNNAAVLTPNVTPVPISGNSFIPTYPYTSGHYTNNQIWAQTLGSSMGLNVNPSLLGGTDYAFGGARTGPLSSNPLSPYPPSLETQTAIFLVQHANAAPTDALYVVAGGGNDARDALSAIEGCSGNASCINGIVSSTATTYATNIETIVTELELVGARNIVVWDTPDLGKAPAIMGLGAPESALGSSVASTMNLALLNALVGDKNIKLFDLYGLVDSWTANPGNFGLTNVTDACAQLVACDPSKYLFWDGIHPTSAGHQLISNAMSGLVTIPLPSSLTLFGIGLATLRFYRRKSAS